MFRSPNVIFSPILAIMVTKFSSTELLFCILFFGVKSESTKLFKSASSLTKSIKSSFLATKSVSQFTSKIDV